MHGLFDICYRLDLLPTPLTASPFLWPDYDIHTSNNLVATSRQLTKLLYKTSCYTYKLYCIQTSYFAGLVGTWTVLQSHAMSPPAAWVDCALATDNWHSEFACTEVYGVIAEDSGDQELAAVVQIESEHALVPLAMRHCETSVQKQAEESSVAAGTGSGHCSTDCTPHLKCRMLDPQNLGANVHWF